MVRLFQLNFNMGLISLERTLLIIVLAILTSIGLLTVWLEYYEFNNEVNILNPTGDKGTALVVYQLGISNFQRRMAHAFAEGLVSSGWRVEITTVSTQAPTDVSGYSLLVLGWPTYWFNPSLPVRKYLSRIGDIEKKNTVIICTAAGSPLNSCETMKNLVQAANGKIVKSLTLFTLRPNMVNGVNEPDKIAFHAGQEITLPRM